MKSAIVGAGAVGAYLAALMTRSGEDVTLIARGATLAAISQRGVRVESAEGAFEARPVSRKATQRLVLSMLSFWL